MSKLENQLQFLLEIDKVKNILRQSVILGDPQRRENDAEHSWHMAICAMILKEYVELDNINMEKVLKMILIHDLVEIYAGDVPAFAIFSPEEKAKKEMDAAKKIFSLLPPEQNKEFMDLWSEFELSETNNAKYANVFDRFQGFMQNITSDGHTWRKFSPSKEMVIKRMKPIAMHAPVVYKEIVYKKIDEYIKKGVIK
ncbi:HD domain-containing protein [Fusobacterium sp. PH5-44]|uniref:HD domain-containing protein n=1 Tax=unclassified Fusobacterium TaxID=2648384 RepID=UPI003D1C5042